MERKTIGTFIAVLRKSRGMTQKELAERVGVSDKTISHWERDESAPDISVLPVLADIFDVTVDELLRGEKQAAGEDMFGKLSPKSEKQLQYLLEKNFHKFKLGFLAGTFTMMFGVLLALLLYEWFAAPLSLIAGIFFAVSMLLLGIFAGNFEFAMKSEDFPQALIAVYKKKLKYWMIVAILCDVSLLLFVLPLALGFRGMMLVVALLTQIPTLTAIAVLLIRKKEVFK